MSCAINKILKNMFVLKIKAKSCRKGFGCSSTHWNTSEYVNMEIPLVISTSCLVSSHFLQLSLQHAVCKIMTSCETEVIQSNEFNQETNWKPCNLLPNSVNPRFLITTSEESQPSWMDRISLIPVCMINRLILICVPENISAFQKTQHVIEISFEGIFLEEKQKLRLLTCFL